MKPFTFLLLTLSLSTSHSLHAQPAGKFGGGDGDGYGRATTTLTLSPNLPIELGTWAAKTVENGVLLEWTTIRETNHSHFVVERSVNGEAIQAIGNLSSAGNSVAPQAYFFIDKAPYVGENAYRLRSVDLDGNATYSRWVKVFKDGGSPSAISLYPNPARLSTSISFYSPTSESASLNVYNMLGQQVLRQLFSIEAGDNEFMLDVSELPNGPYWVVVEVNGKQWGGKLIVRR